MSKSRNWCFTINGNTEDVSSCMNIRQGIIDDAMNMVGYFKYIQLQIEKVNRYHIQGFVCCCYPMTMSRLKKLIHEKAHLEIMKGTVQQSIEYCSKEQSKIEGTEWKMGEPPMHQGKRSDMEALAELIKSKPKEKDIFEQHPKLFLMYNRGITKSLGFYIQARTGELDTDVRVYFGKPGTGKSRKAFEHNNYYIKDNTVWWDGYDGQELVIFDDFDGDYPYRELLKILDRYPMNVQVKGGYIKLTTLKFIITSNKHPMNWYPHQSDEDHILWQDEYEQTPLKRRIKEIIEFK